MNDLSPNRIDAMFAKLRSAKSKAFIAYISAGDPNLERTLTLAGALESAGVDLLELGVPFSDPLADGTVNQAAASRALAAGATVSGVLRCVRELRERSAIPIVLYTYVNPAYAFGFERFLEESALAGVDGLLLLDLPLEQVECNPELRAWPEGLRNIRLVAPTTPPDRTAMICRQAQGFIYYVSREGVTGEQAVLAASIEENVAVIRRCTDLPVAIGFGISSPEQARSAAQWGDAVVVGSAIVRKIGELGASPDLEQRVADLVRPMVEAIK